MEPHAAATEGAFFKKQSRNKNMRKRPTADEEDGTEEEKSAVASKSKVAKKADGRLGFSSGAASQKQERTQEESADRVVEEPKRDVFVYESTRQVQTQDDSRATAVSEIETAFDRDNRAIRERVLKQASEALKGGESSSSKVYKGINGYIDHKAGFRQEHTISREKAGGAHGPLRASAHIRMTVRFDYQPDICKDYKETGYCGYGDSCKFMHDRGDYKSGKDHSPKFERTYLFFHFFFSMNVVIILIAEMLVLGFHCFGPCLLLITEFAV